MININCIKKEIEQNLLKEDFGLSGLAVGIAAGSALGVFIQNLINKYLDKFVSCKEITDEIIKSKCVISILNSMIMELNMSKSKCHDLDDPAQCNLDIMLKIDKLLAKKEKLLNKINRIERRQNFENNL